MSKKIPRAIGSEIYVKQTAQLELSVADELLIPDPIIASGAPTVNENSQKYDRRSSGGDHLQDLIAARQ